MSYSLRISTTPSLRFPVHPDDRPTTRSFWGADRDNGARPHEGVDIFAKKGTPALAAADGIVSSVGENALGGKVVFFRPQGKKYTLYYAHLDSQFVQAGQSLRAGDRIGSIGNTGNARTTPAHLHFGIYTDNGAIDPFPFIEMNRLSPTIPSGNISLLNTWLSTTNTTAFLPGLLLNTSLKSLPKGTAVTVISATGNGYRVMLPNGVPGYIKATHLTDQRLQWHTTTNNTLLRNRPDTNAAIVREIPAGLRLTVNGLWDNFLFVSDSSIRGWIQYKM